MKEVNVTDFRQHLPTYLSQVRRGQRIVVTSRGRPVAELGPPKAEQNEVEAARRVLKGSVIRFDEPTKPAVDPSEWEALK